MDDYGKSVASTPSGPSTNQSGSKRVASPDSELFQDRVSSTPERPAGRAKSGTPGRTPRGQRKPKKNGNEAITEQYFPLEDVPVEVFENVAKYMQPKQMNQLGHSSKGYQEYATSDASKHAWINCFEQFGIPPPECPNSMNKMNFIELLFEDKCVSCDEKAAIVDFTVQKAYCNGCRTAHLVSEEKANEFALPSVAPYLGCWSTDHYTTFYIPSGYSPREHDPVLYSVDEIDAANEEAMTDAFHLLPKKWARRFGARVEEGATMAAWHRAWQVERRKQNDLHRTKRQMQIQLHLCSDGWIPEEFPRDTFEFKRMWNDTQPLTQEAWHRGYQRILPQLEARRLQLATEHANAGPSSTAQVNNA